MGVTLGLGIALVVCVGGYALGALTFPVLEDDTSTPMVQIEPNQTEAAFVATSAQQTLEAAPPAAQTLTPTELVLETANNPTAAPTTDLAAPTAAATNPSVITPAPSPLPVETEAEGAQPVQALNMTAQDTPAAQETAAGAAPQPATATEGVSALPEAGTPIVGTPPVGNATPALGLPSGPAIPSELDAIKTEMVTVDGGTYLMGTTLDEASAAMDECALYGTSCTDLSWVQDSTPPHPTTVDTFQMEIYEVSIEQYVAFLNWLGPNQHKIGCQGQPCALTDVEDPDRSTISFDGTTYAVRNSEFQNNHPATLITWWGASEYCRTLNRRLPTEAEWERAARGKENYIYPWGFEFDQTRATSSFPTATGTVAVNANQTGTSPYGIYNMAGNVSEWVSDWYQADYYTQQMNNAVANPQGPVSGTEKVHRGGSWDTKPLFLRSVHRMSAPPGNPGSSVGFRCVASGAAAGTQPTAPTTTNPTATGAAPGLPPAPTQPPAATQAPLSTSTPSGPVGTLSPGS
jgi:formylglycine-generating enzyme required for sulfatase activity